MSVYILNIPLNISQDLRIPPPCAGPPSACMFCSFLLIVAAFLLHHYGHVLFLFVCSRKRVEDAIRLSSGAGMMKHGNLFCFFIRFLVWVHNLAMAGLNVNTVESDYDFAQPVIYLQDASIRTG